MIISLDQLQTLLKGPKPGIKVQARMSPVSGHTERYYRVPQTAKEAGVMLLLYPEADEWHTIFIKRSSNSNDKHSGQISFPGGSLEPCDLSPAACALRETEEELGIKAEAIQILGSLSDLYVFASNFLVYPFVGIIDHEPVLSLDQREVQSAIKAPISYFTDESIIKHMDMDIRGFKMKDVPYYDLYGEVLWGATAMMFSEFLNIWNRANVEV